MKRSVVAVLVLVLLMGLCGVAQGEVADGDSGVIGYIVAFDRDARTIEFDAIEEWLVSEDVDRLKELGVDPETVMEYYIYNPDESTVTYTVADDAVFELIDWYDLDVSNADFDGFVAHCEEWDHRLYEVFVGDDVVTIAKEVYTP